MAVGLQVGLLWLSDNSTSSSFKEIHIFRNAKQIQISFGEKKIVKNLYGVTLPVLYYRP
jgi:hypothetical protein